MLLKLSVIVAIYITYFLISQLNSVLSNLGIYSAGLPFYACRLHEPNSPTTGACREALSLNALHVSYIYILRNNHPNTVYPNECDQHSQHSHIIIIFLSHSQIADVLDAHAVLQLII